ncbi:hypothetical protein LX32DRAFT_650848 [Colletotrichum zoysiae]|uniref:Uncharacterized protein n=1 Tax=Colletotrichum zoysiae TaxID=1216348 RepID=A0AAD9M7C9_9PEZI|nr:hypothetical protein LX32DRAFT_650848 [Colletotrichum zoysiae]
MEQLFGPDGPRSDPDLCEETGVEHNAPEAVPPDIRCEGILRLDDAPGGSCNSPTVPNGRRTAVRRLRVPILGPDGGHGYRHGSDRPRDGHRTRGTQLAQWKAVPPCHGSKGRVYGLLTPEGLPSRHQRRPRVWATCTGTTSSLAPANPYRLSAR